MTEPRADECDDCLNVATCTPGYLGFTDPGLPLVLYEGPLRRTLDGRTVTAPGTIELVWKRSPHLNWSVNFDENGPDWRTWRYSPDDSSFDLGLDLTPGGNDSLAAQISGTGQGWIPGGFVGTPDDPIDHVVAHWVNLPHIMPASVIHQHHNDRRTTYSGRWTVDVGGWQIVIDARPDHQQAFSQACADESFVIAHTMDLRRADGSAFTGRQASDILAALQYALSFAVGYWAPPAAPVGYAADGTIRWAEWGPTHGGRPRRGAGWWVDTRSDDLRAFVAAYVVHWNDPALREPLRFATTSAILAVETGFVEQRLQTAYSALEMLSWVTEVLEGTPTGGKLDEDKWHKKGSAWRLRRLLGRTNTDLSLAASGPMKQFADAQCAPGSDQLQALALVRDRLTHPRHPGDLYQYKGLVAEASRIACRYLELAILHRIDYRGHISNRTVLGGWIGDAERAPWSEPPSDAHRIRQT